MDLSSMQQWTASLNELMTELHRRLVILAVLELVIWLGIAFFIFQAGRWYERSRAKVRFDDEYWDPKEPTL